MFGLQISFRVPAELGPELVGPFTTLAKGPFGLRVRLQPAHLSTTQNEGFTSGLPKRFEGRVEVTLSKPHY